jgi:ABC-type sulfate transport system substrate-binding protein
VKDKDYLSTLKSALLKSEPTVIKTELFGATVFIRRLTGDYLISYEEKWMKQQKLAQCAGIGAINPDRHRCTGSAGWNGYSG